MIPFLDPRQRWTLTFSSYPTQELEIQMSEITGLSGTSSSSLDFPVEAMLYPPAEQGR